MTALRPDQISPATPDITWAPGGTGYQIGTTIPWLTDPNNTALAITTSYNAKTIEYTATGAISATLPVAVACPSTTNFCDGMGFTVQVGVGVLTLTYTSPSTINGQNSITVGPYQTVSLSAKANKWYAVYGIPQPPSGATGSNALKDNMTWGAVTGGAAVMRTYLAGLVPSNDGATPNTVIDVSAGTAADDTNAVMITLSAAFKKTTGAFTAGTGNGCLDTGTIAATGWYYLFVISNSGGTTVDVLCTASLTSPTLPSGYTLKRWIGVFATSSSNIRAFNTIDGRIYKWQVATLQTSTATTSQTLVVLDVPPGVSVEPLCRVSVSNAAAATVLITDPYVTDAAPSTATPFVTAPGWDIDQPGTTVTNGTLNANCPVGTLTDTSGRVATHASAASTTVNFITRGFRL